MMLFGNVGRARLKMLVGRQLPIPVLMYNLS